MAIDDKNTTPPASERGSRDEQRQREMTRGGQQPVGGAGWRRVLPADVTGWRRSVCSVQTPEGALQAGAEATSCEQKSVRRGAEAANAVVP